MACLLLHIFSPVGADATSGWLSTSNPQIHKLADLVPNVSPGFSNRDCTQQTYSAVNPQTGGLSTASDCFAESTLGQMDLYGSPVLFNGTTQAVQLNPHYPYLPEPIPNQGSMLALTSASVTGSYMHFYTDIRKYLTPNYAYVAGPLASYTINHVPDFSLKDKNGALIATNAQGTLSYSSNGDWMLVDMPGGSFLRINMATFDITPFAQSINPPGDYTNRYAATAISDDGQYAAIASSDYGTFKVYDLSTCTGTTINNYSQPLNCQSRDYWPWLNSTLGSLHNVFSVRFINDDNLSLTASYNWHTNSSYNVGKFTFTAPGKEAHDLDYLALGDSYISGEGEFQYKIGTDTDNNKCHQSPLSYPFIIGADLYNQYNSIACSGAKTQDIIDVTSTYKGQVKDKIETKNRQIDPIIQGFDPGYLAQLQFVSTYQPQVVTLSIGGNDIGFADIVTKCIEQALPRSVWKKDCYDDYADRAKLVQAVDQAYGELVKTYQQILAADPGVQLYVIGYPQVLARGSCGENVQLTDADINFAQGLIDFLDTTIQQAAAYTGVRYVDVQDALDGHRLCEATGASVAVNGVTKGNDSGAFGLKFIGDESFHPNVLGHQLLAQAILNQTNNLKQAMPAADSSIKAPSFTDPKAVAFLNNYPPPSGFVLPSSVEVADDDFGSSTVRGATLSPSLDATRYGLAPSKSYQLSIISPAGTTSILGTYKADTSGNLQIAATIPSGADIGPQTFSLTGTNISGQTVEIDAHVFVGASATDMDGDGVPDTEQACYLTPASGTDVDSDGIDDACDPVIGAAPTQGYPATVRLTGNTILVGN